MKAMLEMSEVAKSYGAVPALGGVDLRIAPGEMVGLLGPNGAGKTSLLSIAVGLRRADSGTIRVGGLDPARNHRARALIGYAPQSTGVYPSLTVADNLRLYGRLAGVRGRSLENRIQQTGEALDLTGLLDRKAENLSGGERRRVHVAGAVVSKAPLVILDEATAGMDVDARRTLIRFVRSLADDGVAILYSTHYLHEVEDDAVRLVILDRGRIIAGGRFSHLLREHGHSFVEMSFHGAAPLLDVPYPRETEGHVLRITSDDPPVALAAALQMLGPEAAHLAGVEILKPSLDGVFAELTGRRWDAQADASDHETTRTEVDVVSA